ncbi:energy transducer TonB family protein [Aurantiacibacter sp. MUD61]|uniref:energy transducer TonB family protein n=1 Tax=Aurantiacibacter sp. MUD61 TaxID=3009083 RepID=UPI0022F04F82|nr:energy transducer TonB [Aurantiacibacter sp. MUD61]
MTKLLNATFAIALVAGGLSVPLHAQDQAQDTIIVQPASSEAVFAGRLTQELDQQLARVRFPLRVEDTGIVRVRFVTDDDGTPGEAYIYESSGSRFLDRAAVQAVSRMDSVGPAPWGSEDGQQVQANIIFANSEYELGRLTRRLEAEESERTYEPHILALNVVPASRH